jgi:alpha-L-fucosidase
MSAKTSWLIARRIRRPAPAVEGSGTIRAEVPMRRVRTIRFAVAAAASIAALVAAARLPGAAGAVPADAVPAGAVPAPAPAGPTPSPRQLAWHELAYYGFVHFTVNTFTDREWGSGDESPDVFAPTALDAGQWARAAKEAGMKGLILTAKHHDGFCLWPSALTDHSVKASRWRDGKGDVVREFVDACRREGLAAGLYLSPWDRNHAEYARPAYLDYYRGQLRELLTGYGPLFEVWFDGANGGDGYYGGARETRKIDGATYYEWPKTWGLVRELQPQAVMFSDAGPDVRWVGNENGLGFETTWMGLDRRGLYPGAPGYQKVAPGQPDAPDWVPPEVDVSIRPGWFYHPAEDAKVKTVRELVEIYYASVGRSANLLLNVPPDRRGLFHETDVLRLRGLRAYLDATFGTDLARGAKATADAERGGSPDFAAARAVDGDASTYWATDDGATTGTLQLELRAPARFDQVRVREAIALGQRVEAWALDAEVDGAWKPLAEGTTVGVRRILRFPPVTASKVRLRITRARACPAVAEVALFLSAPL